MALSPAGRFIGRMRVVCIGAGTVCRAGAAPCGRMNLLTGLLWSLGGLAIGGIAFGVGASVFASLTHASTRDGAVGYFVVGLGLVGALLGLVAGLMWYGLRAPAGEGLRQLGQGALGLVLFVAVVALGGWAWAQTREVPLRYEGLTQASLLLEFRAPAGALPAGAARQWLVVDVNTATTRPVALVLEDEVRDEGAYRLVPAIQGPLVRSGRRMIVARLTLPDGERHEVFMPPMPRTPDPKAGWSEWVSPRTVFDVKTEKEGGQPVLQMRWRIQLYGD